MHKLFQAQIDLAKHFADLCHKHQIWYALDGQSLLSAHRHQGFSTLNWRLEVVMNVESYRQLLQLAPAQVVDSSLDRRYKHWGASFVWDRKNWHQQNQHIKIRILVPSTIEKVERFRSWKNVWLRIRSDCAHNLWDAIEDLHAHEPNGFYLLGNRRQSVQKSWLVRFDPETTTVNFHGISLPSPQNYTHLLERWFGPDWQTGQKWSVKRYYLTPLKRKRVKKELWNQVSKQQLQVTAS